MNFNTIIDNIFKTDNLELNTSSRLDAFCLVFSSLKSNGILKKDINSKEIEYIVSKLNLKLHHSYATELLETMVFLELTTLSDLLLDEEKNDKVNAFKNDEEDVLDEEGYMVESPKTGPMYIDLEYDKLLGIKNE
jgi:hypothetical protein